MAFFLAFWLLFL